MHAQVNSRPDCAYTINGLTQYLCKQDIAHVQTLKRTMRYIKGTLLFGIKYQKLPYVNIRHGFSHADWAGHEDICRSTSEYCFLLAGGVISWSSKKQECVVLSFTESEYIILSKATGEAAWLRKLLCELEFQKSNSTTIYCDSQSAIALSANLKYHFRNKHVDTHYHFTREKGHFSRNSIKLSIYK